MIVCIPATGDGLDAQMDVRLGRAANLVFVDTETGEARTVSNTQNLQAAQGAGIQTAQRILDEGAKAVVAANCGPKAFAVLQAGGVAVYTADGGTVAELVEKLKAGQLPAIDSANVEGRWV
jgi:predicted Fe-Mo cluster-binding NifX family protein